MTASGDQRGQWREAELAGRFGMPHAAGIRRGIDAVTLEVNFGFALLPIHLRPDAVARCRPERLKRALEPIAFGLAQFLALRQAHTLLNDDLEEVLRARIDGHLPAELYGFQSVHRADRLDLEGFGDSRLFAGQEDRGDKIRPRIPERVVRIVRARMGVVDADLPVVAAVFGAHR